MATGCVLHRPRPFTMGVQTTPMQTIGCGKFHQIHHSVKEMGVASHFRYHWMENILYKPTKLAVLALFAGWSLKWQF